MPGHERPVRRGRVATKRRAQVQPREAQQIVDGCRGAAFPPRELRDGHVLELVGDPDLPPLGGGGLFEARSRARDSTGGVSLKWAARVGWGMEGTIGWATRTRLFTSFADAVTAIAILGTGRRCLPNGLVTDPVAAAGAGCKLR